MIQLIKTIIERGAASGMTEKQFLEREIQAWKSSKRRKDMIAGEQYYVGDHDIIRRKREVIGADGILIEAPNLPNNKILDNQYGKMVDQKANYLLAKPVTFETKNEAYRKSIVGLLDNRFRRLLKNIGTSSLNGGIGWLHPYYNDAGKLTFMRFEPYEVLPFWRDADHTELDAFLRIYTIEGCEGGKPVTIEKVEYYTTDGIKRFVLKDGRLIDDVENPSGSYFSRVDGDAEIPLNWERIPLIPFKFNAMEIPLINRVKSLQDAINAIESDFMNNMQEDARNTILVLVNYDGTNLGEFRHNLAQYGVIKVRSAEGGGGDVKTLQIEVNANNYKAILEILKKALIENARGFDAKDDRMSGNPNQMNIQSMYSDIDLDANGMETEYQASFEELFWFLNVHFANTGIGDFEGEEVKVIFNRDILINETESIEGCMKSLGVISTETIVSQHPWVTDAAEELKRIKAEKKAAVDDLEPDGDGDGQK